MRIPYDNSFSLLRERVEIIGDAQKEVLRPPRHDDDAPGPGIFRKLVEDVQLEDLTLPGLYVGRSELRRISFCGSDLHLSAFNWSDLADCDFSGADLSASDLRACNFVRCRFSGADLSGADMRGSTFNECQFADAVMTGTRLFRKPRLLGLLKVGADQEALPLSGAQRAAISWLNDQPEPGGG